MRNRGDTKAMTNDEFYALVNMVKATKQPLVQKRQLLLYLISTSLEVEYILKMCENPTKFKPKLIDKHIKEAYKNIRIILEKSKIDQILEEDEVVMCVN